jgi:hypothetical protein
VRVDYVPSFITEHDPCTRALKTLTQGKDARLGFSKANISVPSIPSETFVPPHTLSPKLNATRQTSSGVHVHPTQVLDALPACSSCVWKRHATCENCLRQLGPQTHGSP